jgi:hypothetical protein
VGKPGTPLRSGRRERRFKSDHADHHFHSRLGVGAAASAGALGAQRGRKFELGWRGQNDNVKRVASSVLSGAY